MGALSDKANIDGKAIELVATTFTICLKNCISAPCRLLKALNVPSIPSLKRSTVYQVITLFWAKYNLILGGAELIITSFYERLKLASNKTLANVRFDGKADISQEAKNAQRRPLVMFGNQAVIGY